MGRHNQGFAAAAPPQPHPRTMISKASRNKHNSPYKVPVIFVQFQTMLKWQIFRRILHLNFIKICGVPRAVVICVQAEERNDRK